VINKIIPVILSGGSGTRLWPLSRSQHPKQYIKLTTENTMLQDTILRLKALDNLGDPIIVCSQQHRFLVAEQLNQINVINPIILLEPNGRNTAPAITAAAIHAQNINKNDHNMLLILPADHIIKDVDVFHKVINLAVMRARQDKLITFGIVPTNPNINYGYIKSETDPMDGKFSKVEEFREKPDKNTAESFIKKGGYLWNSGIFMFEAKFFLKEISQHASEIVKNIRLSLENSKVDLDFVRLEEKSFNASPSQSIDYALMEKSHNVEVIPLNAGWNDLGSWQSLYDDSTKDDNGNVLNGDVVIEDTSNSYVYAQNHLLVTIGIKDIVVVDTPNATLIATKEKLHKINKIMEQLNKDNRIERSFHRKVFRPWGWYDSIESGEHFQVKKLHVKSGAKLSLQLHYKRAEHWVIVKGTATVTKDDKKLTLSKGESTYIAANTKHSLENLQNEPLEVIEIQSGVYLGEDDIVRFEDIYGRL